VVVGFSYVPVGSPLVGKQTDVCEGPPSTVLASLGALHDHIQKSFCFKHPEGATKSVGKVGGAVVVIVVPQIRWATRRSRQWVGKGNKSGLEIESLHRMRFLRSAGFRVDA
jgi:hypothetical protein